MVANVAIPSLEQPQIKAVGAPRAPPGAWLWTPDVSGGSFASGPPMPQDDSSWEARAFAEDASSLAAGIWPPRSYPCSFCKREFRSAQALGGHMNVHRRDRARLRQSSPTLAPDSSTSAVTCSTPGMTPAICADSESPQKLCLLYPMSTDSLSKLMSSSLPISTFMTTPSKISTSPASSLASYPVLHDNHQHPSDSASSLPLSLQLLASEAASTLCPQSDPACLLSLQPPPSRPISHIAHSINVPVGAASASIPRMVSATSSSPATSPTSNGTTPCRRLQASLIPLKSESPRKKSAASGFQPYQPPTSTNKNTNSQPAIADNTQLQTAARLNFDDCSNHPQNDRGFCSGLDLELRLGRQRSL